MKEKLKYSMKAEYMCQTECPYEDVYIGSTYCTEECKSFVSSSKKPKYIECNYHQEKVEKLLIINEFIKEK